MLFKGFLQELFSAGELNNIWSYLLAHTHEDQYNVIILLVIYIYLPAPSLAVVPVEIQKERWKDM